MRTINNAVGIPCPRCNPDSADDDPRKRIRADITELLLQKSARCANCGFELQVDEAASAGALKALGRVNEALENVRRKSRPKF